ncbi:MAG: BREX system serine/threonine kinase PglW [Actinomycetales bacterium]
MRTGSDRWTEVTDSEFAHERDGLNRVRELLPHRPPYRAWSNLEFKDHQGRWHEIDLLVVGERRLHLVELKHYRGRISGNAYRWIRNGRSEDSPVPLARRKAQRLASVIGSALKDLGYPGRAPWVQQAVLLHADGCIVDLEPGDVTDLYCLPDQQRSTGLPSIEARLLETAGSIDDDERLRLIAEDDLLPKVLERIGLVVRREREVGSWRLIGPPEEDGDAWQDWPAEHSHDRSDRARIRFFVPRPGATQNEIAARAQLVRREYQLTRRLHHDGLLVPRDLVESELGAGLVFEASDQDRRLDLWLSDHANALTIDVKVMILRQIAEALAYAHENHVVHRDLHPGSVVVTGPVNAPTVRVGEWRNAGRDAAGDTHATSTRLFRAMDGHAPSAEPDPAEPYRAPEGRFTAEDRIRIDVFAFGAVAYHVVTGKPPARSAADLLEVVKVTRGLDLAAVLPDVPGALRRLVRECTNPAVSHRPGGMREVFGLLDEVDEEIAAGGEELTDPLDAPPGTLIGNRFEIRRRLGKGSTAVGLLVTDRQVSDAERVLKVALDDAAGRRLHDEAAALASLRRADSPRIVRAAEDGPLTVGSRTALLLESAGDDTLADVLGVDRRRLSIDLLERWGIDLGEALVALDRAGVDHRDIKPANLGVRGQRSDRARHLVLFDFSLSGAGAAAVDAGTPPYLDPFLGTGPRPSWDSAAERYAAAVTLYEMATGTHPRYGDGRSHPGAITDEVTIEPGAFDPSIADELAAFFRKALARNAAGRFDTAAEQVDAWRRVFATGVTTTVPDDADARAEAATPDTTLLDAGFTARALSAVEPLGVHTVADLVAVDPGALSRMRGASAATRLEVRGRAKQWRETFPQVAARSEIAVRPGEGPLDDPAATVSMLRARSASAKATTRRAIASVLLGIEGDLHPFATVADIAEAATPSRGDIGQVSTAIAKIHELWATHEPSRTALDTAYAQVCSAVEDAGGVVGVDRLVDALHISSARAADPAARRLVAGVVRAAMDRAEHVSRGGGAASDLVTRRRRGDRRDQVMLVATRVELLDAADALAATADDLVAQAREQGASVVPTARAAAALRDVWPARSEPPIPVPDDTRLVRCAARLSLNAAASRRGELYTRDLPAHVTVGVALGGLPPERVFSAGDVADYVRARFPDLPPLPTRPDLDRVIAQTGLDLQWNDARGGYVSASVGVTTSLASRASTIHTTLAKDEPAPDKVAFVESMRARSFLAVVCDMLRLDDAATELQRQFDGTVVDVADVLMAEIRAQATAKGIDWSMVRAADAAPASSTAARGLAVLVRASLPRVEAAVAEAAARRPGGAHPVIVTEASILARYGHHGVVARWADISQARDQAIWVLVPEVDGAATLDGHPLGVSHAGQIVRAPRWAQVVAAEA